MADLGEASAPEGPAALPHRQTVSPLPATEHDMAGWTAACERKQDRGWKASTRARTTTAAIDGDSQDNSSRKQVMAMTDALTPAADDRGETITTGRHEGEVGYTKEANRVMAEVVVAKMAPSSLPEHDVMGRPDVGQGGASDRRTGS